MEPVKIGEPEAAELLMQKYQESVQLEQRVGLPVEASKFPVANETWPLCPLPGCGAPLRFVDTNEVGDIAFECFSGPLGVSHNYQCVYRLNAQQFEPRPLYGPGMERIPLDRVVEMTQWIPPLTPVAAAPKPAPAPRPELPPTLVDDRPVALTPSGIAAMFTAGASMSEIAAKFGISLAEVEASIRVAKLMNAEPESRPAAAPAPPAVPPRRRRRMPEQSNRNKRVPEPPPEA